jgi:pantetheine-phosphate adenylyltransferase
MNTIIYPGSFDPITLGHVDLIQRAAGIFEKVIVAVGNNTRKNTLLTAEERVKIIKKIFCNQAQIEVCSFSGLIVDFAKEKKAKLLLRGARTTSDFDIELQLASMNRALDSHIETLFLTPREKYAFISSTIVREIITLNGDISAFVPPEVIQALQAKRM